MKSFIISIIIFSFLIILIIANSIYIHKIANEMLKISESLSPADISGVNELCTLWQKHRLAFSISINDTQIEKITDYTENIKSAATLGNDTELEKYITLLSEILKELKQLEEISFQGII